MGNSPVVPAGWAGASSANGELRVSEVAVGAPEPPAPVAPHATRLPSAFWAANACVVASTCVNPVPVGALLAPPAFASPHETSEPSPFIATKAETLA